MHNFTKNFVRATDGTWICIRPAEVTLPSGRLRASPGDRFAPGEIVLGVHITELMDRQHDADTSSGQG